jgi:chemotaxis protein methyltransferase CheR
MAFTFFFRDLPVIETAAEHLVRFASGRMRVRVWDAGCALGQETYTLAIVLADKMGQFAFRNLRIDATDYDSANHFGDTVDKAVYHFDELKRMPDKVLERYFEPADQKEHFRVISKLREQVFFRYHDLLSFEPVGMAYSLIVCKNVLLHFSYEQRIEVLKMFHRALLPGGFITTEHTQKMPGEAGHLFRQVLPDSQLFMKIGSN